MPPRICGEPSSCSIRPPHCGFSQISLADSGVIHTISEPAGNHHTVKLISPRCASGYDSHGRKRPRYSGLSIVGRHKAGQFHRLFPHCHSRPLLRQLLPKITGLELDLRHIGHPLEAATDQTSTALQQPKIELSHLMVINSKIVSNRLLRPRCAFAVHRLRGVQTDAFTWAWLQDNLASSLPSLESLVLTSCTFPPPFFYLPDSCSSYE
jgi:hypothetical protein